MKTRDKLNLHFTLEREDTKTWCVVLIDEVDLFQFLIQFIGKIDLSEIFCWVIGFLEGWFVFFIMVFLFKVKIRKQNYYNYW